jgi:predicted alpha/beta superfamily hydrolase
MKTLLAWWFALLVPCAAAAPPRASTAQPNVHVLAPLPMPGLERTRTIRVYLPPGYERSRRRYPVLYMHDGQNLFDDATSYVGEWGVDETLNELARTHKLELIVVGIDHGGERRVVELNPWESPEHVPGEGAQYLKFVVDVVKPWIDAHYRTRPDRAHTAILGSSLGGLVSHYAIFEYPQVFGAAGIFSPAYWYAPAVFDYTASHPLPRDVRLYFYAGGQESERMLPDLDAIVATLRRRGFPEAKLRVDIAPQAAHNEAAWRAAFPRAVLWLFADAR